MWVTLGIEGPGVTGITKCNFFLLAVFSTEVSVIPSHLQVFRCDVLTTTTAAKATKILKIHIHPHTHIDIYMGDSVQKNGRAKVFVFVPDFTN